MGGTQAQKATCPSLAGREARWPAAPHAGRVTVPLQQGAQHGGGAAPPHKEIRASEEGVDVRALMEHTAHSQGSGKGGSCSRAPGLGLRTVVLLEGRGEGINRGLSPEAQRAKTCWECAWGSVPGAG